MDQMLDTGQLIFHRRGNWGILNKHRQDVLPGLGSQRQFLGDVLRLERRGTGKQDKHLAVFNRVDDFLAPQLGPVDSLMVDPDLQPLFTQLFHDREHLFMVEPCVTDKYLGSHRGVKIRAGFKSLFRKSTGAPGFGKIENQLKVGQGHKKKPSP